MKLNNLNKLTLQNNIEGVKKFIAEGGDVNIRDENGKTALMEASWLNRPEIAKTLIKAGADVDLQNKEGWTALMEARYHPEIVELLIKAGADENIQNNEGKTALYYAKQLMEFHIEEAKDSQAMELMIDFYGEDRYYQILFNIQETVKLLEPETISFWQ